MNKQPKIETYYDMGCDNCTKHRSTDFGYGWETSKKDLRRYSKHEGWIYKEGIGTLCPECAELDEDVLFENAHKLDDMDLSMADPKNKNYRSVKVQDIFKEDFE